MRCIFCKTKTEDSQSVEHIIPESLGNVEHVLPPGVVCDKCNNYFSRKIERPLLESYYFLYARFENLVSNKKGRIPIVKGFLPQLPSVVDVEATKEGFRIILNKEDVSRFPGNITSEGTLYILHPKDPKGNARLLSRFLGKAAIEALAHKVLKIPNALDVDIVNNKSLDNLRDYARRGNSTTDWTFHQREIYPANAVFYSEQDSQYYDVPHEYTFLYTDEEELYFVLAIFGIEYAINMGEPELEGYCKWLQKNQNKSPLYMSGVDYSFTRRTPANFGKGLIGQVWVQE